MLPRRIPKPTKRASRWRSLAHCNFVRSHACCACGSMAGIEVAHVRIGSGAGLGQKPDDWNTVRLCRDCHSEQHRIGETSFEKRHRINLGQLAKTFALASPRATQIRMAKQEKLHG